MDLQNPQTPDRLRTDADERERAAAELRQKARVEAEQHVLDADQRADEMCRTARDYRALADEQDAQRQPATCRNCGTPVTRDSLGPKHVEDVSCPEAVPVYVMAVDAPEAPAEGEVTR